MGIESLASALAFVTIQGYLVIFLIMVVEGPLITMAAAFAASLGYFDVWIVLALSVCGDLAGDFGLYAIGKVGRMAIVNKVVRLLKIKAAVLTRLEALLRRNIGKSMLLIKFLPFLATPGLMLTGALHAPLGSFALYSLVITISRSLFFTGIGYFAGTATETVLKYYDWGQYSLLFVVVVGVATFFLIRVISAAIVRRIDRK